MVFYIKIEWVKTLVACGFQLSSDLNDGLRERCIRLNGFRIGLEISLLSDQIHQFLRQVHVCILCCT